MPAIALFTTCCAHGHMCVHITYPHTGHALLRLPMCRFLRRVGRSVWRRQIHYHPSFVPFLRRRRRTNSHRRTKRRQSHSRFAEKSYRCGASGYGPVQPRYQIQYQVQHPFELNIHWLWYYWKSERDGAKICQGLKRECL